MVLLCRTKTVAFLIKWNIIKLTEPNTPLNDADHVGSFLFPVSAKKTRIKLETNRFIADNVVYYI